jgi:hypothetical protein
MTVGTGSRHDMAYIAEAAFGVTPATPEFKPVRHTGTTLGLSKDGVESEELRQDRQVASFRHGNKSVAGDINFELSYGSFDDFIEAALCGTWTSDVLLAGITRRSFTIQRVHADIAQYLISTGCSVNTISLSIAPNSMVTGTFGIVGQDSSIAGSALADTTYAAETTTEPFDSFTGAITEGGSGIASITAIELNVDNGMEALFAVGSAITKVPSIGKSTVTGSITAYFEDASLVSKFINETASSIVVTLTDVDGNDYIITLPRVKYNSGLPEVAGPGAVSVTLEFIALFHVATGSQIKIERAEA